MNKTNNKEIVWIFVACISLFLTIGVVSAFTAQSIPMILRSNGRDITDIGWLLYIKSIAWMAQFLYSPFVERYRRAKSHRTRTILIVSNILIFLGLVFLSLTSPSNFIYLGLFEFVTSFALSVSAIGLSGLMIDKLKNFAYVNALRMFSNGLGMAIGGGASLVVFYHYGWRVSNLALTAIIIVLTLPLFFLQANSKPMENPNEISLFKSFKSITFRKNIYLLIFCQIGIAPFIYIASSYFVDKNISLNTIGAVQATYGAGVMMISGILGGMIVKFIGSKKSFLLFLGVDFIMLLVYLYSDFYEASETFLLILLVINSLAEFTKYVAIYSLSMEFSRGPQAGVDFSLFSSLSVILFAILGVVGSYLVKYFGWGWIFWICLGLTFICFWTFYLLEIRQKPRIR